MQRIAVQSIAIAADRSATPVRLFLAALLAARGDADPFALGVAHGLALSAHYKPEPSKEPS